jgi:hypothetical protein
MLQNVAIEIFERVVNSGQQFDLWFDSQTIFTCNNGPGLHGKQIVFFASVQIDLLNYKQVKTLKKRVN